MQLSPDIYNCSRASIYEGVKRACLFFAAMGMQNLNIVVLLIARALLFVAIYREWALSRAPGMHRNAMHPRLVHCS